MQPSKIYGGTLRLRITKATQPFCFPLRCDTTPSGLISDILSVFDYPQETDVLIKNENTGELIVNLSLIDKIDQDLLNGSFFVSFQETELKTQDFYDKNNSIPQQNQKLSHKAILKDKISKLAPYHSLIFKHQFFTIVVKDIINNNCTPVTETLTQWVTLIDTQIVISSMIEIASTEFSDYFFWTDLSTENGSQPQLNENDQKLTLFSTIMAQLALYQAQYRKIVVPIIDPFRPSKLSALLLKSFINVVLSRCPLEDASLILSNIFSDSWLLESFVDYNSFGKFISVDPLPTIFPFLYIRSIVLDILSSVLTVDEGNAIIQRLAVPDLVLSAKLAKSIVKPLMSSIFIEIIRRENIKDDSIQDAFFLHERLDDVASKIMEKFIKPYQHAQYATILTLQKLFAKRNFNPPGLFHVVFGYFYQKKILSVPVINAWINNTTHRIPGKESALLELNTFILTEIPNSLSEIVPAPLDQKKVK